MIDDVAVIQMGTTYFWVMKECGKVIASSALIAEKSVVEVEAESISHQLGLGGVITIEER